MNAFPGLLVSGSAGVILAVMIVLYPGKVSLIRRIQRALGVGGIVWAISLLPRTSWSWWIGSNLLYGVMALASAALPRRGYRRESQAVATAGLILFAGVNGAVAYLACTSGGACTEIVAMIAIVIPVQAAIVKETGFEGPGRNFPEAGGKHGTVQNSN